MLERKVIYLYAWYSESSAWEKGSNYYRTVGGITVEVTHISTHPQLRREVTRKNPDLIPIGQVAAYLSSARSGRALKPEGIRRLYPHLVGSFNPRDMAHLYGSKSPPFLRSDLELTGVNR